jgi:hypothetical protein
MISQRCFSLILAITFTFLSFNSVAQKRELATLSQPSIQFIDSSTFSFELELYDSAFGLTSMFNDTLSEYMSNGNWHIYRNDSNWVFSNRNLSHYNDFSYDVFDYEKFIQLYYIPLNKLDTILEHDDYYLLGKSADVYTLLTSAIFDQEPFLPRVFLAPEKPIFFYKRTDDYLESRILIRDFQKTDTYGLYTLREIPVLSASGEFYKLNDNIKIAEFQADSIVLAPNVHWFDDLLIKKGNFYQLIDLENNAILFDSIINVLKIDYISFLFANESKLLYYHPEFGYTFYDISGTANFKTLGYAYGYEYIETGVSFSTPKGPAIFSFDGIIQLEEKKLNDTIGVFKLNENEYRLIQTKTNFVLLDSISEYKMINPDLNALLFKKADTFLLFASDHIQRAKFTLFENARQEFFSEILVDSSALKGWNFEKFLKIDVDTVFSQLNPKDSSHYWSNLFSYCIYPIDTASVEVRIKLIDTLIEVFPELSELYYIKTLFHLQSKNNELILSQLKNLLAKAPSASNHLRSAAVLSLMSSKNKKIKNLVMDDVLQSISILEVSNENPYVLADLYLFSIRYELENKLKRINVCSQLAKINKLFDDGKLTKGDFFNHDLEYIMQLKQECP